MPNGYYTGQCSSGFTFTVKDITKTLDQARSLGILPKFLTWGSSILIYWLYTSLAYLELAYYRPKYDFSTRKLWLLTTESLNALGNIQGLQSPQPTRYTSLLAYIPVCRTRNTTVTLQCWFLSLEFQRTYSSFRSQVKCHLFSAFPCSLVSSSYCLYPQYSFYLTVL